MHVLGAMQDWMEVGMPDMALRPCFHREPYKSRPSSVRLVDDATSLGKDKKLAELTIYINGELQKFTFSLSVCWQLS